MSHITAPSARRASVRAIRGPPVDPTLVLLRHHSTAPRPQNASASQSVSPSASLLLFCCLLSERDVAALFAPSSPPSVVLLAARIGPKADPAVDANVEGTSASARPPTSVSPFPVLGPGQSPVSPFQARGQSPFPRFRVVGPGRPVSPCQGVPPFQVECASSIEAIERTERHEQSC